MDFDVAWNADNSNKFALYTLQKVFRDREAGYFQFHCQPSNRNNIFIRSFYTPMINCLIFCDALQRSSLKVAQYRAPLQIQNLQKEREKKPWQLNFFSKQ
jgi:hypothetical protein